MSGMLIRGHSVAWLMWQQAVATAKAAAAAAKSAAEAVTRVGDAPRGRLIFIWLCRRFLYFYFYFYFPHFLFCPGLQSHTFNFYALSVFLRHFYCFVFTAVAVNKCCSRCYFWVIQFSATIFIWANFKWLKTGLDGCIGWGLNWSCWNSHFIHNLLRSFFYFAALLNLAIALATSYTNKTKTKEHLI